jgi:arginase family protein
VPADPAAITSALDRLDRMPVYLHLDVDVIDSAQLPGLRFPSGPGPAVTQIEECLSAVCARADVRALASRPHLSGPERYHLVGPTESSRISLARCTAEERS